MTDTTLTIVIGTLATIAGLLVAISFAYQQGYKVGAAGRRIRIGDQSPGIQLSETEWELLKNGTSSPREHVHRLTAQQFNGRIFLEPKKRIGPSWSAEGVISGRQVGCIYIEKSKGSERLGVAVLELSSDGEELRGVQCLPTADSQGVQVQPILFQRR